MTQTLVPDSHQQVAQCLLDLDSVLAELRRDIETLNQLQPVVAADVRQRIERACEIHGQTISGLQRMSEELGVHTEPWTDRQGFEVQVAALSQELAARAQDAPRRERLRGVAETLRQGAFTYMLAIRDHYEEVRRAAVNELDNAAIASPVPELPGPSSPQLSSGAEWLRWVWGLLEVERARLLDELYAHLPRLVAFVEEVKPEKFQLPQSPGPVVQPALPVSPESLGALPSGEPNIQLTKPASPVTVSGKPRFSLANVVPVISTLAQGRTNLIRVDTSNPPVPSNPATGALNTSRASSPTDELHNAASLPAQPSLPVHADRPETPLEPPQAAPALAALPIEPGATPLVPASNPEESAQTLIVAAEAESAASPNIPNPDPLDLPAEIQSLDAFANHRWICPDGRVASPPWKSDRVGFITRVRDGLHASLAAEEYAYAHIYARALDRLGVVGSPTPIDVQSAAGLAALPLSSTAGIDASRVKRLRQALTVGAASFDLQLWIGLEAMRPASEQPLGMQEVDQILGQAGFSNVPMERTIAALLRLAAEGVDALPALRVHLRPILFRTSEQIDAELRTRRGTLRDTFRKKFSAAGGALMVKHTIRAWQDWMESVQPVAMALFPVEHGGQGAVNEAQLSIDLIDLADAALEAAERYEVLYQDRRRYDREAQSLLDGMRQIRDLAADLHRQKTPQFDTLTPRLPISDINALATQNRRGMIEEIVYRLLYRTLGKLPPKGDATIELTPEQRAANPRLADLGESANLSLRMAALLLSSPQITGLVPLASRQILVDQIAGVDLPKLRALCLELDEVAAVAQRRAIAQIVEEVAGYIHASEGKELPTDRLRLVSPWLSQVLAHGHMVRSQLQPVPTEQVSRPMTYRELLSRDTAVAQYPDPQALLAQLAAETPRRSKSGLADVLAAWEKGLTGEVGRKDQPVKTRFCVWVLDSQHPQYGTLYKAGRNDNTEYVLPTNSISAWLRSQGLNPSFVPQINAHTALVVITPPERSRSEALAQAILSGAAEHRRDLVVVLVPRLASDLREEILAQASRRDLTLAVVDDVDLLRLINPGGPQPNRVLGLLELILEQQPISRIAPFAVPDGQHIAIEMFVGRREEARDLAISAKYSRVFSGRKLGKSALLKYVGETYDGHRLPSQLLLRVVYVSSVGARHEHDLVYRILAQLKEKLGFVPMWANGPPPISGDLLAQALSQYVARASGESLLIFLDEADVFVEDQIRQYSLLRESCLSFRMRSEMSALTDSRGLPRVRFVFAGYRVTNKSQGAWANWGQVLQLGALAPDDAAKLIGGPLGRIGIQASNYVDAIAQRCGYQPSVLLQFGQNLLARLPNRKQVTTELISDVFYLPAVQEEIWGVIWRNFEGNPAAAAVFAAFCVAIEKLPPWPGLPNAQEVLLERIQTFDADLAWLGADEASQHDEIARLLREFAARELVVYDPNNKCHRLRFPHHLTAIFGQRSEFERQARAHIVEARRGAAARIDEIPGLLSACSAESVIGLTRAPAELTQSIIIGWHWPEALGDPSGGVVAQLGFTGKDSVRADQIDWSFAGTLLTSERLAVLGAHNDIVKELRQRRSSQLPPVLFCGGADLLRWALGRDAEPDEVFEFVDLGRLSQAHLSWWLSRRRGLEFNIEGAIDRIWQLTSGIPLLVRRFDRILSPPGAESSLTVTGDRLDAACDAFERALPEEAVGLISGPRALQLALRERELLRLLVHMSRNWKHEPFEWTDLEELFPYLKEDCPVKPPSAEDHMPLQLLQMLGLLPVRSGIPTFNPFGRLVAIPAGDALLRLVAEMEKKISQS